MTSSPNDPRKIPLRIRLPFATEDEFITRYGANVTSSGIFISTPNGKPDGTGLSFELVLQDGARLMRGEGVVHAANAPEHLGKRGMWVRFTRIDARTKALIDLTVQRREAAARTEPPAVQAAPLPTLAKKSALSEDDVIIGIDFGSTACRVAVVMDGKPALVPIESEGGAVELPSLLAFDDVQGRVVVGSAARSQSQVAVGIKRLLGLRASSPVADSEGRTAVELSGRVFPVVELVSHLFGELKNAAQTFLGRDVNRAVVGVPAWYSEHQRSAVVIAGQRAGLDVVSLIHEPSAVALSYGFGRGLARKRVLVLDLGGGTFDASVFEITGDDLEAVSTGGDGFLGGLDFDARLGDRLMASLPLETQTQIKESKTAVERFRQAVERAKITLSDAERTSVELEGPLTLRIDVGRQLLESATQELVERTGQLTREVLEAARLSAHNIDEVLLAGRQSRAPAVHRHLVRWLDRSVRADFDASAAVALGAALRGHGVVNRERGKRSLSVSEVLSSPIGVGNTGNFRRVLERNTRFPAEKSLSVPVEAGQQVRLRVMQGVSLHAEENDYLGTLSFQAEKAGEMSVHFSVDVNGRLSFSATTPTGKQTPISFNTKDDGVAAPEAVPFQHPPPEKGRLFEGFRRFFGSK